MPRKWMLQFTKDWIDSIPKTVDSNGCWIPNNIRPGTNGYIRIMSEYNVYLLHRIVMCVYYNIDYNNKVVVSRHSYRCDKRCFNPEHIKPGSDSDNQKDSILHGTQVSSRKEVCPKCGGPYRTITIKHGISKGRTYRECFRCKRERIKERRRKRNES